MHVFIKTVHVYEKPESITSQMEIFNNNNNFIKQIILVNGWPTPQIARKKANRGGASQIQEHTY